MSVTLRVNGSYSMYTVDKLGIYMLIHMPLHIELFLALPS